jgi:hypothetical protein
VLDEYREHQPLTLRQIYYRLVGARGHANAIWRASAAGLQDHAVDQFRPGRQGLAADLAQGNRPRLERASAEAKPATRTNAQAQTKPATGIKSQAETKPTNTAAKPNKRGVVRTDKKTVGQPVKDLTMEEILDDGLPDDLK